MTYEDYLKMVSKSKNKIENMKTIKQIAEEIGVSKQAVHKKRHQEPLSTSLQSLTTTVDGVVYVSVDGEKLIKKAFLKDLPSTSLRSLTTTVDGVDVNQLTLVDGRNDEILSIIEVLKKQLEAKDNQFELLRKELEIKNNQIEKLNERLEESHRLLNQQQQLNAIAEQKIQMIEHKEKLEDEMLEQKKWYEFWK